MKNSIRFPVLALGAGLLFAACDAADPSLYATTHGLSFEEWSATLEQNDRGDYIVEGDIAIRDLEELRRYFDEELPHDGALSVITENNVEMRWSVLTKYDLSYCISDDLGTTRKQQAVDAMNAAARAWEAVAEVRFVHLSGEDANCNANNTNVLFNVRSGDCGSTCQASAFFPGDVRSERELLLDSYFWAPQLQSPYTQSGILMHELGHILGFRHEHIWDACTTEGQVASDGRSANQLTPTDTGSVMYYLWCANATNGTGYQISEQDAIGAACKYNESFPRQACGPNRTGADSSWRSNGANRTWGGTNFNVTGIYMPIAGDFDGDDKDDVFFYGRGSRYDFIWWANNTGSFNTGATEVSGLYEPVAGDFDGDGRDDIFWYGGKSRADYIWFGNANRTFTSVTFTFNGELTPKAGDFDGDGCADILAYGPGSAADYIYWSDCDRTFTRATITIGGTYDVFVVDQNGDGRDDIFWYEPGTTSDPLWRGSSNRTFTAVIHNVDGDYAPIAGNFDGQSGEDIIWYAPGATSDFVWYSNGSSYTNVSMTITANQVPITGDFDGDGDSDLLWYSPL